MSAGAMVALTISIDSWFWGEVCWPEIDVLRFNTVQNRSSAWGVLPWHWYFTYAVPRTFTTLVPLLVTGLRGMVRPKTKQLAVIAFLYIGLYSFLPHKELRFLFPVLPVLTIIAAVGGNCWYIRATTKRGLKTVTFTIAVIAAISLGLSVASVGISSTNYPGAEAVKFLRMPEVMPGPVHISVYPA